MTKKILLTLAVLIVLIIAYWAIKSDKLGQVAGVPSKVAVETKRSFDSTGYGAVQLIDHDNQEYYCNLVDAESCDYGYKDAVAVKLVAIPAEGSAFGGWLGSCDYVSTTNADYDTCELTVYESKRTAEVRFVGI